MPITKTQKKREPLWKEWDRLAQKKGVHHAVLTTTGDTYTGDWYDNKKNGELVRITLGTMLRWYYTGKGNQIWRKTGAVYDGDWKDDNRHGYGVYSVMRSGILVKEYAGGWKNDKKHVSDASTVITICMWLSWREVNVLKVNIEEVLHPLVYVIACSWRFGSGIFSAVQQVFIVWRFCFPRFICRL